MRLLENAFEHSLARGPRLLPGQAAQDAELQVKWRCIAIRILAMRRRGRQYREENQRNEDLSHGLFDGESFVRSSKPPLAWSTSQRSALRTSSSKGSLRIHFRTCSGLRMAQI